MKTSTLFLTFLSAADIAAAAKFVVGPPGWAQSIGINVTESEDYKRLVARQAKGGGGGTGTKVVLKNRTPHIANSKSVKIRYGPFTVNGGGPNGGEGMVWNQPSPTIAKPCSDCMIVGMNAGLEYSDGSEANTDTKLWLHHMVLFNIGTGAWDATCTTFGLPHMIVGSLPATSERIFSSGNERTTVFFNPVWTNTTNMGYPVYSKDRFGLITDLMNMNAGAKTVYLVMYYDYVEGHPSNFQEVKPVWFDVAQCGISEVGGRTPGAKFEIKASAWVANFEGEVLQAGGHLHDGGTAIDLIVDGKNVCKSTPTYGDDAEIMRRARAAIKGEVLPLPAKGETKAMAPDAKGGHAHMQHIMSMTICSDITKEPAGLPVVPWDIKKVKKGQSWVLKASYDYNAHAGMKKGNTNTMSSVMGIAIMFVKTAVKRTPP
jgi:hypothetical protein